MLERLRSLSLLGRHGEPDPAAAGPGPATPLAACRYVVLDTELTSLDQRSNRLLSIGAIVMEGARIRLGEYFYAVVNPGVPVPGSGVLIHRLTPGEVAEGRPPAHVLPDLLRFTRGAALVGHFVGIDLAVLRKELRLAGTDPRARMPVLPPALDTARIHRWLDLRRKRYLTGWDHQVTSLDLAAVAPLYGVEVAAAHHALDDAFLTACLWQKLIYILAAAGISTLGGALGIGRG